MVKFRKGFITVESFDTAEEAWRAALGPYADLLNSPKFKMQKKLGYKVTVAEMRGRYWVVVVPPGV